MIHDRSCLLQNLNETNNSFFSLAHVESKAGVTNSGMYSLLVLF